MVVINIYNVGCLSCKSIKTLKALQEKHEAIIIDVRINPHSSHEFGRQFDIENLEKAFPTNYKNCRALGFYTGYEYTYRYLGDLLGNKGYKSGTIELVNEERGLKVLARINEKKNIILLCTEKKFKDCHRYYIARKLSEINGNKVYNITAKP